MKLKNGKGKLFIDLIHHLILLFWFVQQAIQLMNMVTQLYLRFPI